jgi:hypothetical protein
MVRNTFCFSEFHSPVLSFARQKGGHSEKGGSKGRGDFSPGSQRQKVDVGEFHGSFGFLLCPDEHPFQTEAVNHDSIF